MDTVMASFVQVLLQSEVAILNHASEITAISFSENFSKTSHHDIAKIKRGSLGDVLSNKNYECLQRDVKLERRRKKQCPAPSPSPHTNTHSFPAKGCNAGCNIETSEKFG